MIPDDPLMAVWRTFVRVGMIDAASQAFLHPSILRSWQRCAPRLDARATPRLTILEGDALQRVLMAHFDLIAIARPCMEDIHQFVEGSGFAVLLADRSACVLDLLGDPPMIEAIDRVNLRQGVYWTESHVGTNALALALHDAMPFQVTGAEHYLAILHPFSCSASPIHDANGRLVGVLAMIGRREAGHSHTLASVMAAARAITNQLQTDMYLEEANHRLAELNSVFGAISEGLISWDSQGKITHLNHKAGDLLQLTPRSVLGRPLDEMLQLPRSILEAVQRRETLEDIEATFHVNGHSIKCMVSLQPVSEGMLGPVGYIATLRPIERVHQLVNRLVGARATLTLDDALGQSVQMRRVRRQACA
ncbi:MAG: PAS domain-containing protein, partial [Chloroflexota bacterium]|nr:PAS domain-containing protein [Chloroflexota bacterium]